MLKWALKNRTAVLPGSKMGRAFAMLNLWSGLNRYLEDPLISLNKNAAEAALRSLVVGRKRIRLTVEAGHRGRGPLLHPLETAKLSGVNPRAYVTQAAIRAIRTPDAVTLPSDLT